MMSSAVAKDESKILGKDLFRVEAALKASGIPTTYLHLAFFYENHWYSQPAFIALTTHSFTGS